MKTEMLAIVVFCAVAFGGLGYLFVSLTDGINQPLPIGATAQTAASDGSAPPAGLIVEDDSPIVLGSPSITTNNARDRVVVDFFECIPGSGSLDFGSGKVTFVMQGIDGGDCLIDYSAGEEAVACRVPYAIGLLSFAITDDVPDLGTILDYCEEAG
ncbi:MAG TPA: hypothetical protein VFS30_00055 [Dehalococcoidia bacterium]|nr:hypothetical protein [Dehalococcoidia bacterium]